MEFGENFDACNFFHACILQNILCTTSVKLQLYALHILNLTEF